MEEAAVLHLVPFTNISTIEKEGVWKSSPLCNFIKVHYGPSKPRGHIRRADRRGQGLTGLQESLLAILGILRALCYQLSQALRVGSAQ